MFVATKVHVFVATKVHVFVATSILLSRQKTRFVVTHTQIILVSAPVSERREARVNHEPFRLTEPRLVPNVSVAIAFNSFSPGSALFSPAICSTIAK